MKFRFSIFVMLFILTVSVVAQSPTPRPMGASGRPRPAATPQPDPNRIPVAEAERRIGVHVKFIEQRTGEMVSSYYYTGAQATLESAFRKAGVTTKSMTYADPWGKAGIGLFWSEYVKMFYAYHLDALNRSLKVIQAQQYATKSDLQYLDGGMESWKQFEQLFPKQFDMLVDLYTKSALVGDEKKRNDSIYDSRLTQIFNTRPFRADQYDAVNAERARTNKPLNEKEDLLGVALQTIKGVIAKRATERLFAAIDEKPRSETGTAIGANEREKP